MVALVMGGALPGSLFPFFWISQAMAGEASANRGLDSAMPQWIHSSHLTKVLTPTFPSPSAFSLEYSLVHVLCSQNRELGLRVLEGEDGFRRVCGVTVT